MSRALALAREEAIHYVNTIRHEFEASLFGTTQLSK